MKNIGRTTRPVFIPNAERVGVIEQTVEFDWHLGMSAEVRKRSIKSLHQNIQEIWGKEIAILEASSKSDQSIGIELSAFYLKNRAQMPVENLFQSSKVFELGGPYRDLLTVSPREAKKDQRLKNSGNLVKFHFNNKEFPLEPKSLFYDWLYLNTLNSDVNVELRERLLDAKYQVFTDIEFNPKKSFSCQARTLALCVSLYQHELTAEFITDPLTFIKNYNVYYTEPNSDQAQPDLF